MNYDSIEFFNAEEITSQGTILRFKEKTIHALGCKQHQRGRFYGYRSIGVELRFVMESPFCDLKLRADKKETKVYVFLGDYMHQAYTLKEGVITNLHIEVPEKFLNHQDKLPKKAFASYVVRIIIGYSGYVSYIELNTYGKRRPPKKDEVPQKTLLLYGSSISHGSEALEYINSYPFLLSRFLNIDVLNKAIPGSCQAEEVMCDYLSHFKADMAFIEFGVNVLRLYTIEEYKQHLWNLLSSLKAKKIYFTSVLDNGNLLTKEEMAYNNLIAFREYAKKLTDYTYIEPQQLLDSLSYLTTDLLHPSDFGQLQIAFGLKKELEKDL